MAVQIQLRNDTAANWTAANPVLAAGELGIEKDTGAYKLGNGSTTWNGLGYGGLSGVVDVNEPLIYDSENKIISIDLANYYTSSETDSAIQSEVASVIGTAPESLNTLDELAAALNDDANFASTVTNSLSSKASLTGAETVSNKTLLNTTVTGSFIENILIAGTAFAGNSDIEMLNNPVVFYNVDASANGVLNFIGDSSTTLNNVLSTGQSISSVVMIQNGATAYYITGISVDGTSVTPKWQNASAPTEGSADSIDAYVFTIIKTADSTYTVTANKTQFG